MVKLHIDQQVQGQDGDTAGLTTKMGEHSLGKKDIQWEYRNDICETQIEIGPELVPRSLCPPVALPVPAT